NPSVGGNDFIDGGDDADTAIGGAGNDQIIGGSHADGTTDNAADVLLGDNGTVVYADGSADANDLFSTDSDFGGTDSITGGGGDDIIIGGSGGADMSNASTGVGAGDTLAGEDGNDIVIGDDARI